MSSRARQNRAFIVICILAALIAAIPILGLGASRGASQDARFDRIEPGDVAPPASGAQRR